MNHSQKLFKLLHYTLLAAVVILGLVTIIGTGGSDSSNGNWGTVGDEVENDGSNGGDDDGDPTDPSGDKTNSIGMTFHYIEPGTFMMGSPEDEGGRLDNEDQHQVTLTQGYYMQTTEVTQGQWQEVMGNNPSYNNDCGLDCPVENVSWNDVQIFIDELNAVGEGTYRLPTEAEWEYACRAGSTTAFANGGITVTDWSCDYDPNLDVIGWYCGNSGHHSHPVAQKQHNSWGLYDMHGNVSEWCQDWYSYDYPSGPVTDPMGPISGDNRVTRGGQNKKSPYVCRSAKRNSASPDHNGKRAGFRIVRVKGSTSPPSTDWETTSFPSDLYGDWYDDSSGVWTWYIYGSTTIRICNEFYDLRKTYKKDNIYKAVTEKDGEYFVYFFKNVTSTHMESAGSCSNGYSSLSAAASVQVPDTFAAKHK